MQSTEHHTYSQTPLRVRLARLFRDPEYRHSYAESFTNTLIASQLKANREMRNLSQKQLADLAGMKQSRISTIENVNYESWSVRTLRRIAQALDLVLVIKFESFGNVVREMEAFDRSSLERPSFEDDPEFRSTEEGPHLKKDSDGGETETLASVHLFPSAAGSVSLTTGSFSADLDLRYG